MDRRLKCELCGREADGDARGWRALLADDPRDDEPAVAVVFCPVCALIEFGAPRV